MPTPAMSSDQVRHVLPARRHTSVNVVAAAEGVRALYRLNDITHLLTAEGNFDSL